MATDDPQVTLRAVLRLLRAGPMTPDRMRAIQDRLLRMGPSVARSLRQSIGRGITSLDFEALVDAVRRIDVEEARLVMALALDDFGKALRASAVQDILAAGALAGAEIGEAELSLLGFNVPDPFADVIATWHEANTANLVTNLTSKSQQAIRETIGRGFEPIQTFRESQDPRRVARSLREILGADKTASHFADVVGLTPRQAAATSRFLGEQLSDGVSEKIAMRRARAMAKRHLRRRSENIARTEILKAANMGQQISWEEAIKQGVLSPDAAKVWLTSADERVCPICQPLDGAIIAVGDSFNIERFTRSGASRGRSTNRTPPAHPSCRCTMALAPSKVVQLGAVL